MRLQLSIQRNALPTINILFSTGSGPTSKTSSSSSTIADLLLDVNELVPLESADGEWGLEDYVVEVQATLEQEKSYECLHFQTIKSVFREDDEVVIRGLANEDLRSRRLGGRNQIHQNGTHLIDGVPFGKRRLRVGGRPAISIPPRKRRRLEIGEGEDEDQENEDREARLTMALSGLADRPQELLLLASKHPRWADYEKVAKDGSGSEAAQIFTEIAEDLEVSDQNADDDFAEDSEDDEESDWSTEAEEGEEPLLIKATADFEDADIDDEKDESVKGSSSEEGYLDEDFNAEAGLELSDELKALLAEAEALSDHADLEQYQSQRRHTPRRGKRKRAADDEGDDEEETDFEGFSTPAKKSGVVDDASSDSDIANDFSSDSGDSDSLSSSMISDAEMQIHLSDAEESTSSSGSSDSSAEVDSDSSSADSADSEVSSHYSDEDSGKKAIADTRTVPNKLSATSNSSSATSSSSFSSKNVGIPGKGSPRTKLNNQRVKKKKRLIQLKKDDILPANASFADMYALDQNSEFPQSLEAKKTALLDQLNTESQEAAMTDVSSSFIGPVRPDNDDESLSITVTMQTENAETSGITPITEDTEVHSKIKPSFADRQSGARKIDPISDESQLAKGTPPPAGVRQGKNSRDDQRDGSTEKLAPDSAQRRARLDAASSRRLIFGSLGVRNPKTTADEQAVRDKLAGSARRAPKDDAAEDLPPTSQPTPAEQTDPDAWKEIIELSAVECEYDGVELAPPPFPFQQGWDESANRRRGLGKKRGRNQSHNYGGYQQDNYEEVYEEGFAPDVSALLNQRAEVALAEQEQQPQSRTISMEDAEPDDMPHPANFEILPALTQSTVIPGIVIAFKELDMENFQPVISAYRVARVTDVLADGKAGEMQLLLSKRDWRAPINRTYDAVSGKRILTTFETVSDDDQPDDGVRLRAFDELLEPKIVDGSTIQVAASFPIGLHGSTEIGISSEIVPDSEADKQAVHQPSPTSLTIAKTIQVEVNTPQCNEITAIIKDAGLDSAMDDHLLHPEASQEAPVEQSSPAFNTRSHRSRRSTGSPAPEPSPSVVLGAEGSHDPTTGDESVVEDKEHETPRPTKSQSRSQNSIAYPRLSQLDIDASSVADDASSHQDAQRVDAGIDLDNSNLRFETHSEPAAVVVNDDDDEDDEEGGATFNDSIAGSEVPQSQSQEISSSADISSKPKLNGKSHLQPTPRPKRKTSNCSDQHPGSSSAGNADDHSDASSSSLPSLRELTSSQVQKITSASRGLKASPPALRKGVRVSPPRRGLRKAKAKAKAKAEIRPKEELEEVVVEMGLPKTRIKTSTSQGPHMSQIPTGTLVADLSFSSDPGAAESDGEYGRGGRRRGAAGRGSQSQSQSQSEGIGKRRLLTTKKKSYI